MYLYSYQDQALVGILAYLVEEGGEHECAHCAKSVPIADIVIDCVGGITLTGRPPGSAADVLDLLKRIPEDMAAEILREGIGVFSGMCNVCRPARWVGAVPMGS